MEILEVLKFINTGDLLQVAAFIVAFAFYIHKMEEKISVLEVRNKMYLQSIQEFKFEFRDSINRLESIILTKTTL